VKRLVIALVVLGAIAAPIVWFVRRSGGATAETVPTVVLAKQPFVRRVIAEGNLRAVKATPLVAPQVGDQGGPMKVAWLAADGINVKAKDVVVRFDPTDPEKQLRDGQADLETANAKLGEESIKSATAVAGRDTAAELAGKELDSTRQFQSKDQEIFSRNQIIESEIDETLAGAKKDHAERAKTIERKLSHSKASIINVEQQKAKLAIAHAKTALESMEIRAPHDGVLVLTRDWRGNMPRVGDQLWPGQGVAEIPLLDAMEVEVFVLEVDGSGLAKGQRAEVRIEARPDTVFTGKIRLVDKLAKPRQPGVPVQYFAVVVELEKTDREAMKPGQRVHADLILDEESALVVPRQAVFNKDAKNVVYRRAKTGVFEAVPVELGPATSGRVVVKAGLAEGDEIALRDPTRTLDQLGSGSGSAAEKKQP